MMNFKHLRLAIQLVAPLLIFLNAVAFAQWNERVLYSFQGGIDGSTPAGAIVFDTAGNLYGATTDGGAENCSPIAYCGTVYQLKPPANNSDPWTEIVLYVFKGLQYNDGDLPAGGLVIDGEGNLYGTTAYGGTGNCMLLGAPAGCGTVYELSPPSQPGGSWTEKIIYSFPTAKEGYLPAGDLTLDAKGNLYGVTQFGGGYGTSCDPYYPDCGAVFKVSPPQKPGGLWTETVLHGFRGNSQGCCGNPSPGYSVVGDGAWPNGGLILDNEGDLYGSTFYGGLALGNCQGGSGGAGCGTIFELQPPLFPSTDWRETVIHRFNGEDGANPEGGLAIDVTGNLYGDTYFGPPEGYGLVFELQAPNITRAQSPWAENVLYLFNQQNGEYPGSGLAFFRLGFIYGTTTAGSGSYGEVFQLPASRDFREANTQFVLHKFSGSPDGAFPNAPLIFDSAGNIFSTTQFGGTGKSCQGGCGVVYEVSP